MSISDEGMATSFSSKIFTSTCTFTIICTISLSQVTLEVNDTLSFEQTKKNKC